jgi:hypothetical protein
MSSHFQCMLEIRISFWNFMPSSVSLHCFIFLVSVIGGIIFNILDRILNIFLAKKYSLALQFKHKNVEKKEQESASGAGSASGSVSHKYGPRIRIRIHTKVSWIRNTAVWVLQRNLRRKKNFKRSLKHFEIDWYFKRTLRISVQDPDPHLDTVKWGKSESVV